MILGPSLQAGHVGLAAEQAQERWRQHGGVGMADAPGLAGVVDQAEGVEQRREGGDHP